MDIPDNLKSSFASFNISAVAILIARNKKVAEETAIAVKPLAYWLIANELKEKPFCNQKYSHVVASRKDASLNHFNNGFVYWTRKLCGREAESSDF